ncbi:hypothetical protein GC176_17880 [bacterium]|nr:hypothetical protein [bacterium]
MPCHVAAEELESKVLLTVSVTAPSGPVDINEDLPYGSVVASFSYTGDYVDIVDDPAYAFSVSIDGMGGGELVLDNPMSIDYESLPLSDPNDPNSDRLIEVTIEAMDMMMMEFAQATLVVRVNDVAEDPVFSDPPAPETEWFFEISEVADMGDVLGAIPVTDPQPNTNLSLEVYEIDIASGGSIDDPSTWDSSYVFYADHENGEAVIKTYGTVDYECQNAHDLIVVAIDESGHEAKVQVGVGVIPEDEWYATGVFLVERPVLGTQYYHTAILIVPDDQETWKNDPAFAQILYVGHTPMHYTIVSADASNPTNPLNLGKLRRYPVPESVTMFEAQGGTLSDVSISSGDQNDMITTILGIAGAYGDNLNYHLFPESHPGYYNSNSFVRGVLDAVTTVRPDISYSAWVDWASHPGWSVPVPLDEFGI